MTEKNSGGLWIRHVFFTLTEHGAIRVLDAVLTLALIRIMQPVEYGLFSVYQSWAGLLLLFLPSLEQSLYRDFGKLKRAGKLNEELGAYKAFNLIKFLTAVFFVFILSIIPQRASHNFSGFARFGLLALALALPFSHALYGIFREPLRFEMKQHLVAVISAIQRVCILLSVILASFFYPGNLIVLTVSPLIVYIIFGFIWALVFKSVHTELVKIKVSSLPRVASVLSTTVIWIHLNGVINMFIQTLDTFFLNIARADLAELGRYSVALKAANFFSMLPMALVNSFGVYLGKNQENANSSRERKLMWQYTLIFAFLGAFLLMVGLFIGKPILLFLTKGKISEAEFFRTTRYFYWMLAGVVTLCASYPLSAWLGARAQLKSLFTGVFLPWLLISCAVYFFSAFQSPMLTAKVNIVIYLVYFILLVIAYKREVRR